jgi:hypothetical protein
MRPPLSFSDIERIVKYLKPEAPPGYLVRFEVRDVLDADAYELIAWRHKRDAYGLELTKTYRAASVDVDPRDLIDWSRRDASAFVAYVHDRLRYLLALIFPKLPKFRIGTRNHAKRLAT